MILPFLQSSAAAVSWAGCGGPEPRPGSWCRASALPHSTEPPCTSPCPLRASGSQTPGARGVPIVSPGLSFPVTSRAQDSEHWLAAQRQGTHPGAARGWCGGPGTVTHLLPGRCTHCREPPVCKLSARRRCPQSTRLCPQPRAGGGSDAGVEGGAGGAIRCLEQINADGPQAVGPAQAKYEICISALHFHMVFMDPPCRNKSKSLVQKPPGLAALSPNEGRRSTSAVWPR